MACPQHQSAMNARKHLFLRVKSAAASTDLWQVCAEFSGHHLSFFCAVVLGSWALPVDGWPHSSFNSIVRPLGYSALVWPSGPSEALGRVSPGMDSSLRRTAGPEVAVSALTAFLKQAVLCCPSGTQHAVRMS